MGRRNWGGTGADADEDAEVNAGGGSSEGKSKGESAVGPCEGVAEYSGRSSSSSLPWASMAALLASASLFGIVMNGRRIEDKVTINARERLLKKEVIDRQ